MSMFLAGLLHRDLQRVGGGSDGRPRPRQGQFPGRSQDPGERRGRRLRGKPDGEACVLSGGHFPVSKTQHHVGGFNLGISVIFSCSWSCTSRN